MAKVTPNDAGVEMVYEALFDHESGMGGMMGNGVTTVTFYKGDMAAGTAYLKDRLAGDCRRGQSVAGGAVQARTRL